MSESDEGKFHVVFVGRKPGIYFSWRRAAPQVTGYPGNMHKGYFTYEQAERAWFDYCIDIGRGEAWARKQIHRNFEVGSCSHEEEGKETRGQHNRRMAKHIAEDTSSTEFVVQHSMQHKLEVVCNVLMIQGPMYRLHEVKLINGVEYRRYVASIPSSDIGLAIVCLGRFGKDEFEAKEDVAAQILKRVMACTGRKIRDFNHYNVEVLEEQLQKIHDEKLELEMEIAMLNEELRMMKAR